MSALDCFSIRSTMLLGLRPRFGRSRRDHGGAPPISRLQGAPDIATIEEDDPDCDADGEHGQQPVSRKVGNPLTFRRRSRPFGRSRLGSGELHRETCAAVLALHCVARPGHARRRHHSFAVRANRSDNRHMKPAWRDCSSDSF